MPPCHQVPVQPAAKIDVPAPSYMSSMPPSSCPNYLYVFQILFRENTSKPVVNAFVWIWEEWSIEFIITMWTASLDAIWFRCSTAARETIPMCLTNCTILGTIWIWSLGFFYFCAVQTGYCVFTANIFCNVSILPPVNRTFCIWAFILFLNACNTGVRIPNINFSWAKGLPIIRLLE